MTVPDVVSAYPPCPKDVAELDEHLSRPWPAVVDMMKRLDGDVMLLGIAGKMGPTLGRMAKRACEEAGVDKKIIGVSRFSKPEERDKLEGWGIQTLKGDLLDEAFVDSLPDVKNVVYMAGMKFGATGNESLTWAMNTHLPSLVCKKFSDSRIAAFSTGNVYGMTPLSLGGSIETDAPHPDGEYAQSCLGRERIFEHFSKTNGTPVSLIRLNYACELRYGVLIDVAQKIAAGQPIDCTMGNFNILWQADANAMALLSLEHAASPAFVINTTGPELMSIQRAAQQIGQHMGKTPQIVGEASPKALLSHAQLSHRLFGYPTVNVDTLIKWVAEWVGDGRESLGKPTKFEVRDGKF